MPRFVLLLLPLFALLASAPAGAWGERGHRLIGTLAQDQLSPAARQQVEQLLAGEPEPSLAGVATWADAMRETAAYAWTAPLHYVHLRDRRCHFDAARDCAGGNCAVGAIQRYAQRLADRSRPLAERREALKFVVHFVADVHQPLHSGYRPDKGGNEFQVSLRQAGRRPQGTNLHAVWDYFMLAEGEESLANQVRRLQAVGPSAPQPPFTPAEAVQWAEISCALTDSAGFYPTRRGRLPEDYLQRLRPLAERRIGEAAAQLARVLETALVPR